MAGISHLPTLLATMQPSLSPGSVVFCALQTPDWVQIAALNPEVIVREAEALTVVIPISVARASGLATEPQMRRITLCVHSDLEAVGLTAAFAVALAEAGISANVVAGYHHDHIYVPDRQAQDAMRVLTALQARSAREMTA